MKKKLTNIWLYLARRDKSEVKVLTVLQGEEQSPARVGDLALFQLPTTWHVELNQQIYDSRMLWEPWVESAETFVDLRKSLKSRGYSGIPVSGRPSYAGTKMIISPVVNTSHLPKKKVMLKKRKD
jgi:hypothetical protein